MENQEHIDDSTNEYYEGMAALESGDYESALGHFQKSLELHPHYATYSRMAKILASLGRDAEAEEAIRMAYECNPRHSQTATAYAEVLAERGDIKTALAILDTVIELNHTYGPAKKLRIKIGGD